MARAAQLELAQAHRHSIARSMLGHLAPGWIQGQFPGLLAVSVKNVDDLGPRLFLAVIDFPKIKEVTLYPAPVGADFFSDAPVVVVLAVFESAMTLEKRLGHINGSKFTPVRRPMGRDWVCTKRTFEKSEACLQ